MRHRIFIAINLPDNIKKKLEDCQSKWPELPIKWTKKENLHVTLIFIGYIPGQELLEICKIARETAYKNQSFSVNLNKICYGPHKKILPSSPIDSRAPRMVWVEGKKSQEFTKLQIDLEKSLMVSENRVFSPHITLGRIRTWEFEKIEPEEIPQVNEEINLSFEVNSIEIMESELKKGGPVYTILESCMLKN